ncbi:mandelate racemase/muconate lactonizing enzyme family protein [Candidatus Haliotispira prima]|uniref:Mandelate racemase/muconate lactonizing enzyme family protein n=1 Tax=Candidatus Haliotispira prima TaxID=3034016 RepID=A0ABY8MIS6_9SPIO|nr:mandelate racemase/muconate lactonizing enzyme family protein [Candidatus Haliotispira prima]
MKSRTIAEIRTSYYRIPLQRVLVDALHGDHTYFELIVTRVFLEDGSEGVGYTYTGGKGGKAIYAMIQADLQPVLIGQEACCIEKLWTAMQRHVHYVGRGGVEAFAIAALDIAMWDLQAQQARMPLWKLLGGANPKVRAYAGAIDLNFSLEELAENNRNYLEQGFRAVKIKLGKERIEEDIARVEAVRCCIGKDILLMIDANTGWSVERAIKVEKQLRSFDVFWIEEPLIPDDIAGYARIADKSRTPLAAGENFHSIYEFRQMLQYGKIDFPQPDASNISGITGWLKVAQLAQAYNLPVSSHGMHELHVSLLAAMPHAGYLEVHSFPIDEYTDRPMRLQDGVATPPDTPGHGVKFRREKLEPHEVKIVL